MQTKTKHVADKSRRDGISNKMLRTNAGSVPVNEFIEHQKHKWFSDLVRIEPNQPKTQTYHMRTSDYKASETQKMIDRQSKTLNKLNMTAVNPKENYSYLISAMFHCTSSKIK
uniref:Uncharacterized protein n=1 Tax=Arion vulgaris TaxID=1028688 RepID=A0A0B7AEH6_9EUPU